MLLWTHESVMSDSNCPSGQTTLPEGSVALIQTKQTKHVSGGPGIDKSIPISEDGEETLIAHLTFGPASEEADTTRGLNQVHRERENNNLEGNAEAGLRTVEEQRRLHLELLSAKRARQAALQQWDQHIADLEKRLSSGRAAAEVLLQDDPSGLSGSVQDLVCIVVIVLSVLSIMYNIYYHTINRKQQLTPPWYHDSKCTSKVLSATLLVWLFFGITLFTRFLVFDDGNVPKRRLSTIESMYLMTQIITTVGYGDLTPSSDEGKAMLVVYAVTGVVVVGAVLQHLLFNISDEEEETAEEEHEKENVGNATATHYSILGKSVSL
jgi:hypothetical protein